MTTLANRLATVAAPLMDGIDSHGVAPRFHSHSGRLPTGGSFRIIAGDGDRVSVEVTTTTADAAKITAFVGGLYWTPRTESLAPAPDPYETAARAAGWDRGGDCGGIVYHKPTWGTWKAAVSWEGTSEEPNGAGARPRTYSTWRACCEGEGIAVAGAG